jgi:hypothetical protein
MDCRVDPSPDALRKLAEREIDSCDTPGVPCEANAHVLADAYLAATRSIAEQKARIEDLELMLRAALRYCTFEHGPKMWIPGGYVGVVCLEPKRLAGVRQESRHLNKDERGLPILDAAARQALAEEEGRSAE